MAKKSENITTKPSSNDLEWNDYVLGLLSDDEKIDGNPTTDGLRRIFEIALDCSVIQSTSEVVQSPDPLNEKRATVVHSIRYVLNTSCPNTNDFNMNRVVSGSADVYWGNCDKIYRNHPVAVAETRAEGRALRRALKLRKVVAAEEISSSIEDDVNGDTVQKIGANQINFMDVISKRININTVEFIKSIYTECDNIYNLTHSQAVNIIRELSRYQQDLDLIPESVKGYQESWK
jgi:hypothetical protein